MTNTTLPVPDLAHLEESIAGKSGGYVVAIQTIVWLLARAREAEQSLERWFGRTDFPAIEARSSDRGEVIRFLKGVCLHTLGDQENPPDIVEFCLDAEEQKAKSDE